MFQHLRFPDTFRGHGDDWKGKDFPVDQVNYLPRARKCLIRKAGSHLVCASR